MEENAEKTCHGRWMSEEFVPNLVSVIIPTYNRQEYVIEAMDSVWNQTYRPIEMIVVDDGSTDNTKEIIEQWYQKTKDDKGFELRYFGQENKGAPAARNYGLIESKGEYIQFFDSDDLLHPRRLECVVNEFKKSSCDFVYTGFNRFCGLCGEVIESHIPLLSGEPFNLLCEGKLWGNTILFTWKRSLISEIGPWNEDLIVYQDHEFIIRTFLKSSRGVPICDVLSYAQRGGFKQISNIRYTNEGWECYLKSMMKLCNSSKLDMLPACSKMSLAKQLYLQGIKAYLKYPDLGYQLGKLAELLGCKLDFRGILYKRIWRMKRVGGLFSFLANNFKKQIVSLFKCKENTNNHKCKGKSRNIYCNIEGTNKKNTIPKTI